MQSKASPAKVELKKKLTSLFQEWILPYVRLSRGEGLSIAHMFILRYLDSGKPRDLASMAKFLGVSKPTVTGIMNTLEKEGFITRKRGSKDRRRVEISFTQKALDVFQRMETFSSFLLEGLIGSIPDELVNRLTENVATLTKKMSVMYAQQLLNKEDC